MSQLMNYHGATNSYLGVSPIKLFAPDLNDHAEFERRNMEQPKQSVAIASPTSRLFNNNAIHEFDSDNDDSEFSDDHRRARSLSRRSDGFFSDVFDPFSPARNLSQVLNMMNQFMENPFVAVSRGMGGGLHRSRSAKETKDALNRRIDMSGLGKEDVKVSLE
ncbi:23.6 kDa heat shock protein, mitochondrial-like [Hibiscus syriacus]|uniref:23.6 kDa heat shock protein, mitochondrial-like n=1 Tax=Hibiscus syriacus TaxID=106335 RepID=UPI0019243D54|nr:23.6 kDa heat shock protein, mitochondrial-like [Hibiscus syriacus]